MIIFTHKGDFSKTTNFLKKNSKIDINHILDRYGKKGVEALRAVTPVDTGKTASSWTYTIKIAPNEVSIEWHNTSMAGSIPLVILLQYGHGTRNGGYVQGIDFINPAIRPIFKELANEAWNEVIK